MFGGSYLSVELINRGRADATANKAIEEYERAVLRNDKAVTFVTACRTSFMFFDGNASFSWTFVSPPSALPLGKTHRSLRRHLRRAPAESPLPLGKAPTRPIWKDGYTGSLLEIWQLLS